MGGVERSTEGLCVDQKAVYVGFVCRDRTPKDIRGTETRRNGNVLCDDYVGVKLDPAHGHRTSFDFHVSARGTQVERFPGDSATKIEWRGAWRGAAARTSEGRTPELTIPFPVLRYPQDQGTFGLALLRHCAVEQLTMVYPDMVKVRDPGLMADLSGLHPPDIAPRPPCMPFMVVDLGDSAGRTFESGMDVQYKLSNGLTALGAYHADDGHTKQTVEPVSCSYTEGALPEVRPLFVTGLSSFFPGDRAF